MHHLLRSPRWHDAEKMTVLFLLGAVLCVPYVAAQVFWLLTGRGPLEWWCRPRVAFVNPFPRWQVKDPDAVWQDYLSKPPEGYDWPPIVPPTDRRR